MPTQLQNPPPPRRLRGKLILAASCFILLTAVLVLAWHLFAHRPPRPTASPITLARFAATSDFANMPEDQKLPYLHAIRNNLPAILAASDQLSREEQVAAVRNVIRSRARIEMTAYLALPAGPARQAHLDKLIDEQELLRQQAAQAAARDGQPIGPDPVMLKQFVESLSPQERIQMATFVYDLLKRRQDRGLSGWPFATHNS